MEIDPLTERLYPPSGVRSQRDRYLLSLFRDGVWEGHGVRSELVKLADGSLVAVEKPQENHQ